jgi:1-acyl-sn-glycerol-3-phosphate acyltransferase
MIRTIVSFLLVGITMMFLIPFGIIVVLFSVVGLRKLMTVCMYRIAQGWGLLFLAIVGCKATVSGRENIPRKGGVCFVSNHGSIFDIVPLLAYGGRLLGFIAKKELLYIPFVDFWIAVLGGLFIDRKNPRKGLKTINRGIEKIRAGGAMIIFPEGRRSRGEGLLPFHPGSLKLATHSGAIIVPVAIAGTYDVFERNHRVESVPISITFCKPINTADIPVADRKQILTDQIYSVIKEALGNCDDKVK